MTEWRKARLDWLVTEERRTVDPLSLGTDDVFLYSIPVLDEFGDGQVEPVDQIGSGKLLLEGGEVLVSKLNPRLTRVLAAEAHNVPTLASTEFIALRPGPQVDQRYLCYWLGSEQMRQFLDGATMSVTRSQQRVRPEVLTKRRVSFPSRGQQCMIADFLDDETARIDALIAKKRRLAALLGERFSAWLDQEIWGSSANKQVPLMHVVDLRRPVMYGIVLPGPDVEEGVPIVKGGDVARHNLEPSGLAKTTFEIEKGYVRSRLRCGDLVFAIRGGIGDVMEVPPEATGANITQDVARISPAGGVVGQWLLHALRSPTFQAQALSRVTGATVKGLNIWDLERLLVPLVPHEEQERSAEIIGRQWSRVRTVTACLDRQIAILHERRQALITAAVTGHLDIPGLAA